MSAIKQWQFSEDIILSRLCKMLSYRILPKTILSAEPFAQEQIEQAKESIVKSGKADWSNVDYFVQSSQVLNSGYDTNGEDIEILSKDGSVRSIDEISDMLSAKAFSQITKKYFLCTSKL